MVLVLESVPFRFEVAAGLTKGQATLGLEVPLSLAEILCVFPTNTGNKLVYEFHEDTTAEMPTTGAVGGKDVFRHLVKSGQFVGENVAYVVPHQIGFKEGPLFLKMQAYNGASLTLIAAAVLLIARER